jgi:hypothetical protein
MSSSWDWHEEGFAAPPTLTIAKGGERVYRAFGGAATVFGKPGRKGVCFSFDRARSRREAERLYSVAEWGNSFWRIATFEVPKGTPMWVGRVHPGDSHVHRLDQIGTQIFIQNPWAMHLALLGTAPLLNDLAGGWVHTGRPGNV